MFLGCITKLFDEKYASGLVYRNGSIEPVINFRLGNPLGFGSLKKNEH